MQQTAKNFREYYYKTYLLKESPSNVGDFYGDDGRKLNDLLHNWETSKLLLAKGKDSLNNFSTVKQITTVSFRGSSYTLYRCVNGNNISDWWLNSVSKYVSANFDYTLQHNEMYSRFVWNFRNKQGGFARWLVQNYYLKNYNAIISDKAHTPQGREFWKSLVSDCINHKMTIINTKARKEEPIKTDNLDQYWTKRTETQIKIYA